MNTVRMMAIALPMALLMACGGGGGGGTAASPTTPPAGDGGRGPTGPQALPAALITDVATARSHVSGSSVPTTIMPSEIQAAFEMEAMDADTLVNSDAFVRNATFSNGANVSGGNITLDDFTFRSSLENIRMGVADRFNLEGVNSQYSPVMDYQGVTLAQYQAAGRTDGNDVLEYQSYGGWLTNSAFSVDMLTIDHGSREDSILIGINYGRASGKPTGSGSARWTGPMVGIDKNNGDIFQGDSSFTIADVSGSTIDLITLNNIRNLRTGVDVVRSSQSQWSRVSINDDGTFSGTNAGGDINGAFYGTGSTEIAGTFNWEDIIGAFGAVRE